MIREGKIIYTREGCHTRLPKKKDLIKKVRHELFLATHIGKNKKTKEQIEREVERAKQKIKDLENTEIQHKLLKRSTKKYKKDKLKSLILELIANKQNNDITVEDYAIKLKAKNGQVYTIFSELVREGVLGNKQRYYAHDTNRNPMFYGDCSGWASNYYPIKKKDIKG